MSCQRAPKGWECTRAAGHDGPCCAKPTNWFDRLLEWCIDRKGKRR